MSRSRLFKSHLNSEFHKKAKRLQRVTELSLVTGSLFTNVVIDTATRKPLKDKVVCDAILDLSTCHTDNKSVRA